VSTLLSANWIGFYSQTGFIVEEAGEQAEAGSPPTVIVS
jgi:hypothetical protein